MKLEDVYTIFLNRTNIDFSDRDDLKDENFFGILLNMYPRDLLMVYMDLKEQYGIKIREADLINRNFCTFNNVINLLEQTCGYSIK